MEESRHNMEHSFSIMIVTSEENQIPNDMKAASFIMAVIIWLCITFLDNLLPIDFKAVLIAIVVGYLIEKEHELHGED